MKTISSVVLAVAVSATLLAAGVVEKQWFACVDGRLTKGQFIDLDTNATERLLIKYCPIADDGVELERTTNNVLVWRAHVQPLGVSHSKYTHEVNAWINSNMVVVISIGASNIYEVHSLETGAVISRRVYDRTR
jgi:hypothetical protein